MAQESRVIADRAQYTRRLTETNLRIAGIEAMPNAIKDPELRKQIGFLEDNRMMLESMLEKIPAQLMILRQSIPLVVKRAKEIEGTMDGVWKGLQQWRQLGANVDAWYLENEPPQVIVGLGMDSVQGARAATGTNGNGSKD
jgi:hypothetical protein